MEVTHDILMYLTPLGTHYYHVMMWTLSTLSGSSSEGVMAFSLIAKTDLGRSWSCTAGLGISA
jgi:hypothetical protein